MKMDDHPQYNESKNLTSNYVETYLGELYKGKAIGQGNDKEYADSRSPGGKMVSGDSKK